MLKTDKDSIMGKDMAKKTENRDKKIRPQMYQSLKEIRDKMITQQNMIRWIIEPRQEIIHQNNHYATIKQKRNREDRTDPAEK